MFRNVSIFLLLSKINSYEKMEIICRLRKENARYLDLLCFQISSGNVAEKRQNRHWLIFVLFIQVFLAFFFFLFFFLSFSRERENRGSGAISERSRIFPFFFLLLFFFPFFLLSSPIVLSFQGYLYASSAGSRLQLRAILMAEIMIEHYGNGI